MPATRTVGAYEAKTTLPALLALVARGHEVIITKHDRPIARLSPVGRPAAGDDVFGRLHALRGRLRPAAGETAADLVRAGRRI